MKNNADDINSYVLSNEQALVSAALSASHENYFVTGLAGSVKSTILKYLVSNFKNSKNIAVVAPTGVAALNIGGQTIHSLFKLDFGPQDMSDPNQITMPVVLKTLLSSLDVLMIDEISMVRSDVMDMIDAKLKLAKESNDPFGGVQILAFGDLCQLPPIVKTAAERDYINDWYGTPYFFGAPSVENNFTKIILSQVYRQTDKNFLQILNKIREGDSSCVSLLNKCCYSTTLPDWTRLTLRRNTAKYINERKLNSLSQPLRQYKMETGGVNPPSKDDVPFDDDLKLKVGAKVMTVVNDISHRYYNGSVGIIKEMDDDNVIVAIDGKDIKIERVMKEKTIYTYNRQTSKIESEVVGWARQFPLRLAYALTVHKSQGQTYDHVVIDFSGDNAFAEGQAYVALSRCRSLDGIKLAKPLTENDIYINKEVNNYLKREPVVDMSKVFNQSLS